MTENGKVQKYRLRERGVTPETWDRELVKPAHAEPDPA
jgi:carnitine-CoA ligase